MAVPSEPEQATHLWELILSSVRSRLDSQQAFDTWFRPIIPREVSSRLVHLEAPNTFIVDWIHEHHLPALRESIEQVLHSLPELRFSSPEISTPSERPPAPEPRRVIPEPPRMAATSPAATQVDNQLNPRLTFETFVVGGANRFTHAACMAVAERPGHVYNPLFIFGGSGLGKTHLLHAIGHAVRHRARAVPRVTYVPAERFTNEMIYAIQHGQTLAFRNRYRNVDLLLIDDVQFLAGKESTQEEFFYTFNTLRDAHKQIVVTADKAPKDITGLEDRLTSRFNQGLIADVKQPDLETRIAILRNRCEQAGDLHLPDDVLLLIADRIRNNIRDLEGCLVRMIAVASLTQQEVSIDLAEEVLHQYINPEPDRLTPERILSMVSERFGVRGDALCGARRTRNIALPRQVAMYLMRQLTDLSLVEIGRVFGGRDHTTVLYACEKIGSLVSNDNQFAEKVNAMISTLASG